MHNVVGLNDGALPGRLVGSAISLAPARSAGQAWRARPQM